MYKKLRATLVVVIMFLSSIPIMVYAQTNEEESVQENNSTEITEEVALDTNTFSEEGNATLGDSARSTDEKEFITVTTRNGNVFYLVIDHQRDDNNVYFLNMVDESDLQAFVNENNDSGLESIVSLPKETNPMLEKTEEKTTEIEDIKSEDIVTEGLDQARSSSNINYLMVIAVVGVFGATYYFKIHKKKGQALDEYETEEEYETEYEQDNAEIEDSEYEEEDEFEQEDIEEQGMGREEEETNEELSQCNEAQGKDDYEGGVF